MSLTAERRKEEKEQRRQQIIDAAEAVMAAGDWETATLADVARRARLSRGLIYFYFQDKTDLHAAVASRALELLEERFRTVAARHTRGIEQVEAVGREYVDFAQKHPMYFSTLMRMETKELDARELTENERHCMEGGANVHCVVGDLIARGVQDGTIRADIGEPTAASLALWAFVHGLAQLSSVKGALVEQVHGISPSDMVDHAMAMIRRTLVP